MLNSVQRMKLINMSDNILKTTPNLEIKSLELAFVFDTQNSAKYLKNITADIVKALKMHSDIYKNVRTNTIIWESDTSIKKDVTPMPFLQMGSFFEDIVVNINDERSWDEITLQLKKFYARSKLVILIGEGNYKIEDRERIKENLAPFLQKKMLIVTSDNVKKFII